MRTLIVPGLHGSGRGHWQTWWEEHDPAALRVHQRDWSRPDLVGWSLPVLAAIESHRPVRIVAHSFGCLAAVCAAASTSRSAVAGAFLVAPADPDRFAAMSHLPAGPLPFRTVLVASTNDPWLSAERADVLARQWGSQLEVVADAGHINVAAGFGPWPAGRALFERLIPAEAGPARARPRRAVRLPARERARAG